MKKTTRIIHIALQKPQQEIVEKIEADGRSLAEIIRKLIDEYGDEKYPKDPGYVEVQKEKLNLKKRTQEEQDAWDKITPEEYAAGLQARVAAGRAWFMLGNSDKGAGVNEGIPLNELKDRDPEKTTCMVEHKQIMAHEYTYPGDVFNSNLVPWSYEDCEKRIKRYNEFVDKKMGK